MNRRTQMAIQDEIDYFGYIIKLGKTYLVKDKSASIMSNVKYKMTFSANEATIFNTENDLVDEVAKRYGGKKIGLLPVEIDVEDK